MEESRASGDVDIGTGVFIGCWFLTATVGITLILRYALKTWIRWFLPRTFIPDKVWGLEDLLVFAGYGFDIIHMTTVELRFESRSDGQNEVIDACSSRWGLGRPSQYLEPFEQSRVLRYGHISEPFGVTAGMISRTGMAWTLLTCFTNRRMRLSILACIVVQVVINSVVGLQTVLQCGPYPYFTANRLEYFHYMWDTLPADGSVKCQSLSVQMIIAFVQGGVNATVDFLLAAIAVIEIWQFFFQVLWQNPGVSFWSQLRDICGSVQVRRALQTVAISGILLLAGAASIAKAYHFKSSNDRSGFPYNMVDVILWTKIENSSIILASCAHTTRLLRVLISYYREGQYTGYLSDNNRAMKMRHCRDKSVSTVDSEITLNDMGYYRQSFFGQSFPRRYESQACRATPPTHILNDCVTVVTDFIVEVNKRQSRTLHSSGQFRPGTESLKDEEARLERNI